VRDDVARRVDRLPLWARLLAIMVSLLVMALLVVGWGVQVALRDYLIAEADHDLARRGRPVAQAVLDQFTSVNDPLIEERRLLPSSYSALITLDGFGSQPVPPARTPEEAAAAPELPRLTQAEAQARAGQPFDVRSADGTQPWRAVAYPIPGDRYPGSVVVAMSLGPIQQAVAQLRTILLLLGVLMVSACAGLGWWAIRRSFAPLGEVERTAAAIAAGDLSRRLPERPEGTEVGRLTAALNGMLAQIESAFQAREASEARTRRFAADASHELRTPLATIRGFAELYRQGAVPPQDVPRTLRRIEDEAARMGGLVEDLLLLARLDEQRPGRRDPVDLTVLAGDAVHDAGGLAPGRPVRLTGLQPGTGPVPAVVVGDEDRLRQVVANLVGNALRHTPAGTPVEVAVGIEPAAAGPGPRSGTAPDPGEGRFAVLEVRDHGPGLDPGQAERVFERFYRVDGSRQRATGGGSGLGLSIVSAVVGAHAGLVSVHETPGGGATFRVRLPATHDTSATSHQ
jgi:two-component system OmpR family sensor kinase